MTMIFTSVIVFSSIQESVPILTATPDHVNALICKELLIHFRGHVSTRMGDHQADPGICWVGD